MPGGSCGGVRYWRTPRLLPREVEVFVARLVKQSKRKMTAKFLGSRSASFELTV